MIDQQVNNLELLKRNEAERLESQIKQKEEEAIAKYEDEQKKKS